MGFDGDLMGFHGFMGFDGDLMGFHGFMGFDGDLMGFHVIQVPNQLHQNLSPLQHRWS